MESSPCPLSLPINPSDGRSPGGQVLKFKGRAKNNLSSRNCSRFGSHVCLNGKWQVVLITSLSLWLPETPSANLAGRLALCPCANVLLESAWSSLLSPLSTSLWNLPDCFSYLGVQGVTQWNEKQAVNWVISKASLGSRCHRGGKNRGRRGKWRLLRVFQIFWK